MEKAYREHGDVLAEHPVADPSFEEASDSTKGLEKNTPAPV